MKTLKISTFVLLVIFFVPAFSQHASFPALELYTMDGTKIMFSDVTNNDQPMVVIFWKSNLKECCNQLCAINELYSENLKAKGVKVVAVCIDCSGGFQHIKPFVYGHNFDFEIYIDLNGDIRRSMNVPSVPFTILYDKNMQPYCKWAGYCSGIEHLLSDKIEDYLAISDD